VLAPHDGACDVSVVIVSWNTRDLLRECLRSVLAETRVVSCQVIVVDNASADGSAAMVAAEFPTARLVANRDNRGFAAANNQGMRHATGRYALFLNPDTRVLDGAIDKMVGFMDQEPEIAVGGCQVLVRQGVLQRTCFAFPSPLNLLLAFSHLDRLFPAIRFLRRPDFGDWARDTQRDVDVVTGMFMLVRRKAIEQVGGMDEDYFVYGEEADWCFRFRRHGWRCTFTPIARIVHHDGGGKSTSQARLRMYVQLQKSLLIFHRKNLGMAAFVLARVVFCAAMTARSVWWLLWGLFEGGARARLEAACSLAALKFHLFGIEPAPATPT
jgi:GT2 family glycosyltransferase